MGTISSGIGLVSGIDSKSIIDQLIALESQPKTAIEQRLKAADVKKTALAAVAAGLNGIKSAAANLKKTTAFKANTVTTSDEDVLTATAGTGAAPGSYTFRVARLVSAQQDVSAGFADATAAKIGAGTLTVEVGGGELNTPTRLDDLRGGAGVRRGQFRVTDRAGNAAIVDTSDAVTLNDVADKINHAHPAINVRATVTREGLRIEDLTGRTTARLTVSDVGESKAAADLGIAQSVAATALDGARLNYLRRATTLSTLNDGRGVRDAGAGADVRIRTYDNSTFDVDLAGLTTVQEVMDKISVVTNYKAGVQIAADGRSLQVFDSTRPTPPQGQPMPPGQVLAVTQLNGSPIGVDLGLITSDANNDGYADGTAVMGALNGTLVKQLRGGAGLNLGTVRFRNRQGNTTNVDLAGAADIQDVLARINASSANVSAYLKANGNGIAVEDKSNGSGSLIISDVTGAAAAQLGVAGTHAYGQWVQGGANLQKAWLHAGTKLSTLNGGKGVPDGAFTITNAQGMRKTVTLENADDMTVGGLIAQLNAAAVPGVTASLNANGDGILLTDATAGTLQMKVEDAAGGSAARALNLAATATAGRIDGSYEKSLAVTADDTLTTLRDKLNELSWGVAAEVVDDGSGGATPWRLSVSALNTGTNGRVTLDGGATKLEPRRLVAARDAVVFVGDDSGAQPLAVTSSTNTVDGAIKGVTLQLNNTSADPVRVAVSRDVGSVVESVGKMVTDFNALADAIAEQSKFNPETNTRGVLLGEPAVARAQAEMYAAFNGVYDSGGRFKTTGDVGLRVGAGARLEFDEEKFRAAYADDPEAVERLFTKLDGSLDRAAPLSELNGGKGVTTLSNPATADLSVRLHDNTTVSVALAGLTTLGAVVDRIETAAAGKLGVELNRTTGGLRLVDRTTGTQRLKVTGLNGSRAAIDLGLANVDTTTPQAEGTRITGAITGATGGFGARLEARLNKLTDPVSGILTGATKAIDTRNAEGQRRIDQLDRLIESKRARLERQYAALEESLSKLQAQQSSLGGLTNMAAATSG